MQFALINDAAFAIVNIDAVTFVNTVVVFNVNAVANKGNDKQWVAVFLIHSTKLCTEFKIMSQVVPEKSVTE